MTEICRIEIEGSPSKVVYAGQLLKGKVFLTLKQMTIVRGIQFRYNGWSWMYIECFFFICLGVFLRIEGKAECRKFVYEVETPNCRNPIGFERYLDEQIICFDGTRGKQTQI